MPCSMCISHKTIIGYSKEDGSEESKTRSNVIARVEARDDKNLK